MNRSAFNLSRLTEMESTGKAANYFAHEQMDERERECSRKD